VFINLSNFADKRATIGPKNAFYCQLVDFVLHKFICFREGVGAFAMGASGEDVLFKKLMILEIYAFSMQELQIQILHLEHWTGLLMTNWQTLHMCSGRMETLFLTNRDNSNPTILVK